jgi:hypothetical protein
VYNECGGHDLAANVLAAAAAGDESLHGYFEWDDTAAAESYRLEQAQALVRRVKVTILSQGAPDPIVVRAYIASRELPADDDRPPGSYVAIEEIAGATSEQAALMESIQRDVIRLRRKYKHVSDFLSIVTEALEA